MVLESGSPADRRARLDRSAFDCPRCGVYAKQTWANLLREQRLGPGIPMEVEPVPGKWLGRAVLRMATCQHCKQYSVWRKDQMIYPVTSLGRAAHPDMPLEVRELYEEAAAVSAVSRRAGAAFARVAVERLLKTIDGDAPPQASLVERIARIADRVSQPLLELLDIVRIAGNGAVHVNDVPDAIVITALSTDHGPELVEMLLDATNRLVDELVARPATIRRLWDTLPPTKRGPAP